MGSYCKFCDRRCFVVRVVPAGPFEGWSGCMATCASGMAHDRKQLGGYDHATSINPITDPEAAGAVAREVRAELDAAEVAHAGSFETGGKLMAETTTRPTPTGPCRNCGGLGWFVDATGDEPVCPCIERDSLRAERDSLEDEILRLREQVGVREQVGASPVLTVRVGGQPVTVLAMHTSCRGLVIVPALDTDDEHGDPIYVGSWELRTEVGAANVFWRPIPDLLTFDQAVGLADLLAPLKLDWGVPPKTWPAEQLEQAQRVTSGYLDGLIAAAEKAIPLVRRDCHDCGEGEHGGPYCGLGVGPEVIERAVTDAVRAFHAAADAPVREALVQALEAHGVCVYGVNAELVGR